MEGLRVTRLAGGGGGEEEEAVEVEVEVDVEEVVLAALTLVVVDDAVDAASLAGGMGERTTRVLRPLAIAQKPAEDMSLHCKSRNTGGGA